MANILGRNDRRRRVLNEEALSASTAHMAMRRTESDQAGPSNAARYSEQAGAENHPPVTDFLPRRYSALSLLAGVGIASTAVVEALYWYVDPVTTEFAGGALGPLALRVVGGVDAWLSAVLMLVAAAACLMIYSLRRHRIDDFRGRYRVWLAASVACLAVSVNSVAPLHALLAGAAAHYSGWTALRAHSAWWLVVAGLPLGWIAVRAWLDARESRLAATALGAAMLLYGASVGVYLAGWPAGDVRMEALVSSAPILLGHWLLLLGVAAYGRYVVLDAQGLVAARAGRPKRVAKRKTVKEATVVSQSSNAVRGEVANRTDQAAAATPTNSMRAFRQGMRDAAQQDETESQSTRWVDGSEPVSDDFGDDEFDAGGRKLSKAERKRLRKLKAQNRAA